MKWSQTLIPTMKEIPNGAEIPSHIFMLRAGMISQVMAGAYAYLPLGWRCLHKATKIVRDEMDKAGGVELFMTALCPQSLYEQTNRVEAFGNVLIKTVLNRGGTKTPVVFCPTHEEEITSLVSQYVSSYRQLPLLLYQIQTKFRNEERPKFGVLRTSEFLMKDAYSFHTDLETLDATYKKMYDAYCKIFTRCGVPFLPVEAESGPIGGDGSHEFMIPSENGEDDVVYCPKCKYAANVEKAEIGETEHVRPADVALKDLTALDTPGAHTIEQVCAFLKAKPRKVVKTLIYMVDGAPVAVLVRGDCDVNENKLRRLLKAEKVELADEATIERVTGAPVGFAGPVGLKEKIKIVADPTVKELVNVVVGANQAEKHYVNANLDRDFTVDLFGDVRNAVVGDACPRCGEPLTMQNAIEVGHVFKLGTKYTEALNGKYLDESGALQTIIMGCYGIGVSRIVAGLAETSHDEHGIIWPVALAPYEVCVCPVKASDPAAMEAAEKIAAGLEAAGVDVILDDRDERPGVKFKDADLIGFPVRVTIGKGLANGEVEVKWRWDADSTLVKVDGVVETLAAQLKEERETAARFYAAKKN
ncbi:MAG: proline--tRNA ligase [Thermoguttaceae bacterium]|nr:proline--tRNA ligase [Thermoguttaceae bacterium]MBQ2039270.1 proline--tRNA ligase [Thermoguttaceae bacterium]MBQ3821529.1 proline--tRNA ligase [Thermoguttaceae bacterium]MBQ5365904.1 proline--tRNA ligase [Thermoguttaceae bacterium]